MILTISSGHIGPKLKKRQGGTILSLAAAPSVTLPPAWKALSVYRKPAPTAFHNLAGARRFPPGIRRAGWHGQPPD